MVQHSAVQVEGAGSRVQVQDKYRVQVWDEVGCKVQLEGTMPHRSLRSWRS